MLQLSVHNNTDEWSDPGTPEPYGLWFGLAWTTIIAVVYALICLTVGSGLDIVAGDEKALIVRLAAMYVLVLWVSLIARFERTTRQAAVEREQRLQRERIELS